MRIAQDDLTATARIRNAAITCFAREGFGVGLRRIADEAGVSLGLIRHHYGSKDDLQAACDAYVLDLVSTMQEQRVASGDLASTMMDQLLLSPDLVVEVHYMVRSLGSGTAAARTFFDTLVESARLRLAEGVRNGVVVPTADEAARARFLTLTGMGGLMLAFSLNSGADPAQVWSDYVADTVPPALEMYTHGLLPDSSALDAYRAAAATEQHSAPEPATTPHPTTPHR